VRGPTGEAPQFQRLRDSVGLAEEPRLSARPPADHTFDKSAQGLHRSLIAHAVDDDNGLPPVWPMPRRLRCWLLHVCSFDREDDFRSLVPLGVLSACEQ
jgi:hypothetical protein